MNKIIRKVFILFACSMLVVSIADAQAKKGTRSVKKRATTRKTTGAKPSMATPTVVDTMSTAAHTPGAGDSLPIPAVKKSLRPDDAIARNLVKDRTPLAYEDLREDDAVYRQKIWREIDIREKMNIAFRYSANEDNGNQRFISILMNAIQNDSITVFDPIDDRFTTPLTVAQVAEKISGGSESVDIIDSLGNKIGTKVVKREVNLDSIYKFHLKEEVIFDKESSRLFWRILGIAPVKNVITSMGIDLGPSELFWVYYPDMRPIFAKYEVYNGKNFGARMSWEELFESRMFYGRIIKSTMDNPYDKFLKEYPGLNNNNILQLLEGDNITNKIFNYEQNLWSY